MTQAAALARADIARLIPQQGAMCLLAHVDAWDENMIVCRADNHRDSAHPLRSRSGLLSSCLIEYAAQAMAVHGALRTPTRPGASQPGFLAAARNVELCRHRLDDLPPATPDELRIEAHRQAGDARQLLYAFSAFHGGSLLASGRISVVLAPAQQSSGAA
ncbi:MAG: 3-hydroxylacyl-ACP dehydratase [Burkholderiaceae bacterium]